LPATTRIGNGPSGGVEQAVWRVREGQDGEPGSHGGPHSKPTPIASPTARTRSRAASYSDSFGKVLEHERRTGRVARVLGEEDGVVDRAQADPHLAKVDGHLDLPRQSLGVDARDVGAELRVALADEVARAVVAPGAFTRLHGSR